MSAIDTIVEWAQKSLLGWQQDALRRLMTQPELSPDDIKAILLMILERHGIKDPFSPAPTPLPINRADIPGVPQATVKITLKALKDLRNINAIADGSNLLFANEGLTAIYGDNGSGKSGYARVLKRACKARDTQQKVLPNVFKQPEKGQGQAIIRYSINDEADKELLWEGTLSTELAELSNICFFDSRCARIIVDENNEATYLPYGTQVFEELADLYRELRHRLEQKKPSVEKLVFPDIPLSTKAGLFLAGLSKDSTPEEISLNTDWTEEDNKKLTLHRHITDVKAARKQIIHLRNIATRIVSLSNLAKAIASALSTEKADALRQQLNALAVAEKAFALASEQTLSDESLKGAGEKAWEALYLAAREYSIKYAYPDKDFPVTDEGSLCVFCMQPLLSDGISRMHRFKAFMEKTTKREVDKAASRLEAFFTELKTLQFPAPEDYKDIMDEFREVEKDLISNTEHYFPQMANRQKALQQIVKQKKLIDVPNLGDSPAESLDELASRLEKEAKAIEESTIPTEYENKIRELAELEAKKSLSGRRLELIDYVKKLRLAKAYDSCIPETDHLAITLASKKIITDSLTPQLRVALQSELEMLGATHIPLDLRPTGAKGETKHKLELSGSQVSAKINLSDILSEGEQCVVAIAGFFAELQVANHLCPIVFDDPVCSLDHNYKDRIAARMIEEAKKRQVIIFTHDIAFLVELGTKAEQTDGVCLTPETIQRISDNIGIYNPGLPWHTLGVSKRLVHLRDLLNDFKGLYEANQQEYNDRAAVLYGFLRETWESFVEETLLNKTIIRHGNEVRTKSLQQVIIETADYVTLDRNMTKCSGWMRGHDKSKAMSINRPAPGEILEDIEELNKFRSLVNKRSALVHSEREKALTPPVSHLG